MDKVTARKFLKSKLLAMTDEQKSNASDLIFERVKRLDLCGKICIYNALPTEVNTQKIVKYLMQNCQIFMPVVKGLDMTFVRVDYYTKFEQGSYNVIEPQGEQLQKTAIQFDYCITPLLGFDEKLNRLGKGKGYYDRFFENNNCTRIALAFEEQRIDMVPCDCYDQPMDMIITPKRIYK